MVLTKKQRWKIVCQSGTGKTVSFVVESVSEIIAHREIRVAMAKKFRGKTFKVVEKPKKIG